jgi:hypothetical protein
MTLALRAAGTATSATAAVTAVNPAVPAGAVVGDLSVLTVVVKPYNTVLTTPSGWTKIGEHTNGTTAAGTDTGSTKVAVYVKEDAAVAAIGNIGQDIANTMGAVINVYSKTKSSWDVAQFTQGSDTTDGANYSATGAGGIAVAAGDWVLQGTAINGDIGTLSAFNTTGLAGATLGTHVNRTNAAFTTGTDCRLTAGDIPVTAGSSSAAPIYTFTNASSSSGTTMWVRLRETSVSNVLREKYTSGADNDTITAGNTGATSVTQTGGSAAIDTAVVFSPTRAILGDATVTSGAVYWEKDIPQVDSIAVDFYIRINTMPSAEIGVLSILNGSTRNLSVNVAAGADAGKIRVRDAGGAGGLNLYTSTAAMSTGVWYRVSIFATQHVTAGTVRVAFFAGAGSTALDDSTLLTGKATGAAPYNRLRWGPKTGTGTATFNAAFDDTAYDLGAADLIPPGPVTYTPDGIASAEAFGTPAATLAVTGSPSGIASAETFGTPAASLAVTGSPSGVASAEAFGTPVATLGDVGITGSPSGIASAEAFGTPAATLAVTAAPSGIASAEVFGTPAATLALTASPGGIASAQAFGTPAATLALTASPSGIASQEAFGTAAASGALTVSPSGIVGSEQFGTPTAVKALTASPGGVPSAEVFGTPTAITSGVSSPTSIPSAEAFGSPTAVIPITAGPSGIPSEEQFGAAVAVLPITGSPPGIPSGEVFGSPAAALALTATPGSIQTAEAFGTPTASQAILAEAVGIPSEEVFGVPEYDIPTVDVDLVLGKAHFNSFAVSVGGSGFTVGKASLSSWEAVE